MKWINIIIIIIFGYKDCYLLVLLTGAMCRNDIAETICRPRHTFDVYLDMFKTCHWLSLEFPPVNDPSLSCYIYYSKTLPAIHASLPTPLTVHVSMPLLSTENYTLANYLFIPPHRDPPTTENFKIPPIL
jgi:hypothetical protein